MKKQPYDKVHRTLCAQLARMTELICKRNVILENFYREQNKKETDKEDLFPLMDILQQNFFELADTYEDFIQLFGDHIGVSDTIFFIGDMESNDDEIGKKIQDLLGESDDDE